MFSKLLKNKKTLIAIVVAIIALLVLAFVLLLKKNPEDSKKPNGDIQTEQEQNDKPYDGDGLDVEEDDDVVQEEIAKAPNSWEGDDEASDNNKKEDETDDGNMSEEESPDKGETWGSIF